MAMASPTSYGDICKIYQKMFACYPACVCEDAADTVSGAMVGAQTALKTIGDGECLFKCGSIVYGGKKRTSPSPKEEEEEEEFIFSDTLDGSTTLECARMAAAATAVVALLSLQW